MTLFKTLVQAALASTCFVLATTLLRAQEAEEDAPRFEGLAFRSIGPAFMSGRISDIAVHPGRQSTWYVAVGSGGVWKTRNAGTTWAPIFEEEGSYSIGCVTLDPSAPETVWVGTGENVSGRHVGYGDGVYKSTDGGAHWTRVGLSASEHIGSIVVHPDDSDVVWVAAQGPLWSSGGERGVYKSTDGGATWRAVLQAGPYTGANEVLLDPSDPNVLYAALHQRVRTVAALMDGGPESGIFKSTDAGETWAKLEGGLPEEHVGKIGLALSPFDSDVVYATIEEGQRKGGFWRSADGGASWTKQNDYLSGGTGPHYYQEIFASPHVPERVYQMDVRLHVTDDGGKTFRRLKYDAKHSDNHALAFDPTDPDYLLVGCDGGIYETWDHGETWRFAANLPVTQFYKVAVDDAEPFYNVYGGTQDNNTQGGPSRTLAATGITNADWFVTLFGDGHQTATEPGNPNIVYSEWQEGNLVRYDHATGEIVYIKPQPGAGEPEERHNWDSPILVSPHDPARIYFASQRVWRSDDRGDSWRPISGDLTGGIDRFREPIMGRTWGPEAAWDTYAMSRFSTITSVSESPAQAGLIWAGTDDGRLHVTGDGGETWTAIESIPGVPPNYFVNDVKADRFDANTAYLVVDDHKTGDFSPYVLRTTDRGRTWTSLAGGLPERHLCWRIVQDHVDPGLLFLGTEFGVWFSGDGGESWDALGGGMPKIPVRDLTIQARENDLVCATFGRGFYVLDDFRALRGLDPARLAADAALFPVRDALWYVPRRPLGGAAPGGRGSQGDAYFVAPNPEFGATFTYHVGAKYETAKDARLAAEADGDDASFPSFEQQRREADEEAPEAILTVRDAEGRVVNRVTGPATRGFHRVAWSLRTPPTDAWQRRVEEEEWSDGSEDGALCPPGTYTVQLSIRAGGEVLDLGLQETFDVVPLGGGTLEAAAPAEVAAFRAELQRAAGRLSAASAATRELIERVGAARSVLRRTPGDVDAIDASAKALERRFKDLLRRLDGAEEYGTWNEAGPVSVGARIGYADLGTRFSTYGATATHRRSLDLAKEALEAVESELASLRENEVARLDAALDALGAPWTPGR